jgi:hypothetical protein
MVNPRDWGAYPSKVLDNTPGTGIIQHLPAPHPARRLRRTHGGHQPQLGYCDRIAQTPFPPGFDASAQPNDLAANTSASRPADGG